MYLKDRKTPILDGFGVWHSDGFHGVVLRTKMLGDDHFHSSEASMARGYSGDDGVHTNVADAQYYLLTLTYIDQGDDENYVVAGVFNVGSRGRHGGVSNYRAAVARLQEESHNWDGRVRGGAVTPLSKKSADALIKSGDAVRLY